MISKSFGAMCDVRAEGRSRLGNVVAERFPFLGLPGRRGEIQSGCSCDSDALGLAGRWSELSRPVSTKKRWSLTGELRRVGLMIRLTNQPRPSRRRRTGRASVSSTERHENGLVFLSTPVQFMAVTKKRDVMDLRFAMLVGTTKRFFF